MDSHFPLCVAVIMRIPLDKIVLTPDTGFESLVLIELPTTNGNGLPKVDENVERRQEVGVKSGITLCVGISMGKINEANSNGCEVDQEVLSGRE